MAHIRLKHHRLNNTALKQVKATCQAYSSLTRSFPKHKNGLEFLDTRCFFIEGKEEDWRSPEHRTNDPLRE